MSVNSERLISDEYVIRGEVYELWVDYGVWYLANPRTNMVLSDEDFKPPLTEVELDRINDYVHDDN